jgi:hypothetical protein
MDVGTLVRSSAFERGTVVEYNPNDWDGVAVQVPLVGVMYLNEMQLEEIEN